MNPLSLINKKNVEITFLKDRSFVARTAKDFGGYKIQISKYIFENMKEDLKFGLIKGLKFHEIAHIRYGSLDIDIEDNNIKRWLFNLFEDDRVEYKLQKDFPLVAKYFVLVLDFFKKDITAKSVDKQKNKITRQLERDITKKLDVLYNFVRYDRLEEEDGELDFLTFVKPLLLSSRRGTVKNCLNITDVIFKYLMYDSEMEDKRIVGEVEQDFGFMDSNKMETEIGKELKEIQVEEEQISKQTDKEKGQFKSIDKKEAFENVVIQKDETLIKNLIAVFRNIINAHKFEISTEGEINFQKLQEAYIDSFVGEEGYNYLSYKLKETSFDAIIFRDISGSTAEVSEEYARATINILAAITYFKNNRVAVIDFEGLVHLRKTFEDKNFSIFPYALGTTDLANALKCASKQLVWQNKKRIVIIICDGYPDSLSETKKELQKDFYNDVEILSISLLTDKKLLKDSVIVKKMEELPSKILGLIGGK